MHLAAQLNRLYKHDAADLALVVLLVLQQTQVCQTVWTLQKLENEVVVNVAELLGRSHAHRWKRHLEQSWVLVSVVVQVERGQLRNEELLNKLKTVVSIGHDITLTEGALGELEQHIDFSAQREHRARYAAGDNLLNSSENVTWIVDRNA